MELSAAGAGDLGRAKQLPAGRERRRRVGTAPGAEAGRGSGMVVVDTAWVQVVVAAARQRSGPASPRAGPWSWRTAAQTQQQTDAKSVKGVGVHGSGKFDEENKIP